MLYRSTGIGIQLKRKVAKKSKEAGNDTGSPGSAQDIKGWKHLPVVCYSIHYGDKAGHFLLMGLLNSMVVMSFTFRRSANLAQVCLVCSLVVGALVTLEESSQLFFASRTASWADLLTSYAGLSCSGFWLSG